MCKITVCQGCYRVFLYENSVNINVEVDCKISKIDFCLQCAQNVSMLNKIDFKSLKNYSMEVKKILHLLDPLEYNNKVFHCLKCKYKTTKNYCYDCDWKFLRKICPKYIINMIDKYAEFDNLFKDKFNLNASYLC